MCVHMYVHVCVHTYMTCTLFTQVRVPGMAHTQYLSIFLRKRNHFFSKTKVEIGYNKHSKTMPMPVFLFFIYYIYLFI